MKHVIFRLNNGHGFVSENSPVNFDKKKIKKLGNLQFTTSFLGNNILLKFFKIVVLFCDH